MTDSAVDKPAVAVEGDAEPEAAEQAAAPEAAGSEEPACKKQKSEGDAEGDQPAEVAGPAAVSAPVKIGYKTFASGADCYKYFHGLMGKWRKGQNLNDVSRRRRRSVAFL